MASSMSDADLQALIVKESSKRLRAEMGVAQKSMDAAAINVLSRAHLISHIFHLRRLAGQSSMLKSEVTGYDPGKVTLLADDAVPLSTPTTGTDSSSAILFSFFQLMNERDERIREENRIKEEKMEDLRRDDIKRAEEREDRRIADEKERVSEDRKERAIARGLEEKRIEKEQEQRLTEYTKRMKDEDVRMEKRREMDKKDKEDAELKRVQENSKFDVRLNHAMKCLRGQLYKMPSENLNILLYLNNMDEMFNQNNIDQDLRVSVLVSYLNDKGQKAHAMMSAEQKATYAGFKEALLKEFRVTALACKNDFYNATRNEGESHLQFSTRLKILFREYLRSRNITDSFEDLSALMVSDKLKDTLNNSQKSHVFDKEGKSWMKVEEIGEMVDIYDTGRAQLKPWGYQSPAADTGKQYKNPSDHSQCKGAQTFNQFKNKSNEGGLV